MAKNSSDYVTRADEVIQNLKKDRRYRLTTSQIRNLLSMVNKIDNKIRRTNSNDLSNDVLSDIQYLRVRFAYEAGRNTDVKKFVDDAGILNELKNIGKDKSKFYDFMKYMEALVAFHRFHGGND